MYIFALFHTLWLEVFGFQHHRPYRRWNLHYLSLSVCLTLVSCPRTRLKWLKRSTKKFCQGIKLMLSITVTIMITITVNIIFLWWNFSYGTPLFKAGTFISEDKVWSWKNVHITFASVTSIQWKLGHSFWVPKARFNLHLDQCTALVGFQHRILQRYKFIVTFYALSIYLKYYCSRFQGRKKENNILFVGYFFNNSQPNLHSGDTSFQRRIS